MTEVIPLLINSIQTNHKNKMNYKQILQVVLNYLRLEVTKLVKISMLSVELACEFRLSQ